MSSPDADVPGIHRLWETLQKRAPQYLSPHVTRVARDTLFGTSGPHGATLAVYKLGELYSFVRSLLPCFV